MRSVFVAATVCLLFHTDDAKREAALKMPQIVEALALKAGSRVADIGAGTGDYETALSRVVGPSGLVYAEDIDANYALKNLRRKVAKQRLRNVRVVHGLPADPKLPLGELDGVLMVATYHEVKEHPAMLAKVMAALKPSGRLVVVDLSPLKTQARPRTDQVKNHVLGSAIAEAEIRNAGFVIVSRDDHFIDEPDEESVRWMIVARKP